MSIINKKKLFIFFAFLPLLLIITFALPTKADTSTDSQLGEAIDVKMKSVGAPYNPDSVGILPTEKNTIGLYRLAIGLITSFIGVMFFIRTIVGGIQWMTAGGNEEKIESARKNIVNGIIGLGIILSAYIITFFVLSKLTSVTGVCTGFGDCP